MVGTGLTAAVAAIVEFAVLPGLTTFADFSVAIGLVLVPAGALMAQSWQTAMFTAATMNFVPLLAPANQMSYDTQQFYNAALAIVAGVGAAALSFRLLPPLSPALRTRRLLALTLRDLRRLARERIPRTRGRLGGPHVQPPLRIAGRGRAIAARAARGCVFPSAPRSSVFAVPLVDFDLHLELDAALDAVARGDSTVATERLARLDRRLAALPSTRPGVRGRSSGARQHSCSVGGACPACRLFRFSSGPMSFTEINLFGVYVAPISLMMVAAWLITIGLRRVVTYFGLLRYVWHPALFVFAIYIIALSSIVLLIAR